tara:strand:- start:394 stop:1704 length:1311 start_codon:yes stop_codon:yes gene_type:complete
MKGTYTQMERDVIGECLYDTDSINEIRAKLSPKSFGDQNYRVMYKTVLEMHDAGEVIDQATLSLKLQKHTKNGEQLSPESVSDMFIGMTSPKSWEAYVDQLNERFQKSIVGRELAKASENVKSGEPIAETMARVEEMVQAASLLTQRPYRTFLEAVDDEMIGIGKRSLPDYDSSSFYVPLPFSSMNAFVKGFRYGALSILGARPSHGKTTFALNCIRHAVNRGVKTMMVSIEMTESEIAQKMLSMESSIPTSRLIQSKDLTHDEVKTLREKVDQSEDVYSEGLSINDTSETPGDVMQCIQSAVNEGHKFIVIDHLHELAFDERRSHISLSEEMGNFVKRLRNMAKKNNIAILALCQLNRDVEKRSQRTPVMSDLGETGALERAAFNILFLYRDEVYNPGSPRSNQCDVIVAKARDSRTGLITLNFRGDINLFYDQA